MNTKYWSWATYGMLLAVAGLNDDIGETGSLFGWERVIVNHGYKIQKGK